MALCVSDAVLRAAGPTTEVPEDVQPSEATGSGTLTAVSSLADELSPAGWPRPWLLWMPPPEGLRARLVPQVLPVPWVNGGHPYQGDWVTLDEARAAQAHEERLCAVCGQPLDRVTLLARGVDHGTPGPGCHPRCMQLTLGACPHFTDPPEPIAGDPLVAWRVDGPDLGYRPADDHDQPYQGMRPVADGLPELTARDVGVLAGIDPWGTGRPDTTDEEDTVAD